MHEEHFKIRRTEIKGPPEIWEFSDEEKPLNRKRLRFTPELKYRHSDQFGYYQHTDAIQQH